MPPAIRTLPSGSRVAVCPERGSSIDAVGLSAPTREAGEPALRNAAAARANVMVKEVTRSRRERFMTFLLEGQTCCPNGGNQAVAFFRRICATTLRAA